MAQLITSFSDGELHELENRAEEMMREALARVMDVLARRIERHDPRAVITAAAGCTFCLSPRHPGPCAKPGGDVPSADDHGHGRGAGPSGGGGAPGSAGNANRTGGTTDVRPELARAQTTDDIERATKDEMYRITGRHTRVDFAGSDPQIAREHAEGVLVAQARHPDVHISEMGMSSTMSPTRVAESHPTPNFGRATSHAIHFNSHAASDPPAYRDALRHDYDSHFAVTAHPGGVGTHEFGHAAMQQHAGYSTNPAHSSVSRAGEAYAGPGATKLVARSEISAYAGTSDEEMGAEAFADVIQNGGGASDMSRAIYAAMGGTP